ncbi:DUF6292 family protein [Sciscionella sediminilitoris]|uniref:DUF6292 family protein n=1 Tax=Sciscionella sediminilitoris TaxID=1445613 RepID=UPI00068F4352|nr:DUF6292 family protein [Sciscionella sp. SE31]
MNLSIHPPLNHRHPAHRALRQYLADVAAEFGIGLESATIEEHAPVSAYLALDIHLGAQSSGFAALLWDEERGWALAAESADGRTLTPIAQLDSDTIAPGPTEVAAFVRSASRAVRREHGRPPNRIRRANGADALLAELDGYLPAEQFPRITPLPGLLAVS